MKKLLTKEFLRLEKFLGLDKNISSRVRDEVKDPDREISGIIRICNILGEEVSNTPWINEMICNRLAALIISLGNYKSRSDRFLITKDPEELVSEINKKVLKGSEEIIKKTTSGYRYKKQIPLVIWDLKCGDKIRELIQISSILESL